MSEDQTKGISQQPSELSQLIVLVQELKEKVELRHYDTRPIWELVSSEISQIRLAQEETNSKVEELRLAQQETNGKVEELNGKVEELNGKVEELRLELVTFRADTNYNFKVLDTRIRGIFGELGEVKTRMDFIQEQLPAPELRV
jgi:chromosome segregation ATPase